MFVTLTKELTKNNIKESFQSKPERIVAQNAAVKKWLERQKRSPLVVENQPAYSD